MNSLWPLWLTALTLMLLALGGLLWPLLRESAESPTAEVGPHERLRCIYRTQREELAGEYQRQLLSDDDYTQAVEELERRLLEDMDGVTPPPHLALQSAWRRRMPAALLTVLLPLGALALYLQVGDPRAAATLALGSSLGTHAVEGVDVEAMVAKLEERLNQTPDNLEGWIVLARSREVMEQFDAATTAYQRAITLAAQQKIPAEFQARLYADLADAMASAHGGALDAPVQAALKSALKLDPNQAKALALSGSAAYRDGDRASARRYWQRLLSLLEPDSDMALRVQNDLARLDGNKVLSNKPPPIVGLAGTVRLEPLLNDRVQPGDTVFIVARAPGNGRMPVAVLRLKAAQLPAKFTLDDSNAMSPDMPLSRFDELTLEARISRSGTAQRQPGQPVSPLQSVHRGSRGLVLTIGTVEP